MSNIAKNMDDLMLVKDVFDLLITEELSVGLIDEVVKNLLPRNDNRELLINYHVYKKNDRPAYFSVRQECIHLSIDDMGEWIKQNMSKFLKLNDRVKVDNIFEK